MIVAINDSAISTCCPSMIVLARLVDPMADVWMASMFTLSLACENCFEEIQSDSVEEQFGSINDWGASLGGSN